MITPNQFTGVNASPPTRRSFFKAAGPTVVLATTSACSFFDTDPTGSAGEAADAGDDRREAPMLTQLVDSGELPPLEERLPAKPLVLQPEDQPGTYGGSWRTAMTGTADVQWVFRTVGYEQLLTWDPGFTSIQPNLAEDYESDDEGTTFTLHLRRNVRWSDGEEFTATDIVFAYEDILSNEELVPDLPAWLSSGGRAGAAHGEIERVDDHTVRFSFDEPNGLFLTNLAALPGQVLTAWPRHYLEQFHIDHNPQADKIAEDEGHPDWVELFDVKASLDGRQGLNHWSNPDLPMITPWHVDTPLGDGQEFTLVRNPYYWKVDEDGRQLPYLDRVVFEIIEDEEALVLKVSNGELDMHARHVMSPQNKPVLANSRDDGGYDFFDVDTTNVNEMALNFNLVHEDPELREIFQNKTFRMALSHAIDRDEIINTAFQRQGEPWQLAPRPDSPFYDEEMGTQYTAYDPDRANELLDEAGLADLDGDGFRLRPNGQRLRFNLDVPVGSLNPAWMPGAELVRQYWAEVGVDAQVDGMDRSLFWERMTSSQHDVTVWDAQHGMLDAMLIPIVYMPSANNSQFAPAWGDWYASGDEGGEEPPEEVRRQMELYDELKGTLDEADRIELFREVVAIAREQFYAIGIVLPPTSYGVVRNDFVNVPSQMPGAWAYPTPAPTRPEQYFTRR